ncbi:MAG: peptidyl-prolyl cis-trans isomerase [Myxococcales bacterium]|nr:peptidyl-prolyl cis-trans isomerase [Myxococcales bacterium]
MAPSRLGRLLREPLVHFAWLAALLIVLTPKPADERSIEVGEEELASLTRQFTLKAKRPPSDAERARLVNDYLRDEVLKREAIALGIHETDPVVKRRLIQSLEYLAEAEGDAAPSPDDADLRAELAAHPERYRVPERLDFVQVFVRAGPDLEERARAVSAELPAAAVVAGAGGEVPRPGAATPVAQRQLGDAFLDGNRFKAKSEQQVAARFGGAMAKALFERSRQADVKDQWLGPFDSRFGKHWIWITARHPARAQRFDEARRELEAEVLEHQRQARRDAFVRKAAARYRIRVEGNPWQVEP